jgi:FkbH-like protein
VGEDGPEGIRLGDQYPGNAYIELQRVMLALYHRGVVLAINSKNNPEDAKSVLERHPGMVLRPEHFAATRINWQDKTTNMEELAAQLGLGLDSFVFLDDSDVECARLRQALPEVLTVQLAGEPAHFAAKLRRLGVFDRLTYSKEDADRGAMYRTEIQRAELRASAQSIEDFYRSLEMTLSIEPVDQRHIKRAADLTQRTNQFNLTTTRYTLDELSAAVERPGCDAYVFGLKDRFGDNGIIGFAKIETDGGVARITDLLLSCRVLKRTVEDAVLAFLGERARARGAVRIEGLFRPTRKNGQVSAFYEERGFSAAGEIGDARRFTAAVENVPPSPPWIAVG